MKRVAKLLAAIMVASLSTAASADCRCSCVNAQIEPVCTLPTDLPPVCAPRACSLKSPSVTPVNQARVASNGPTQCHMELIASNRADRYDWKKVCQ